MPDGTTIEARREPYPSGAVNREYYQVRDLETGAKIIRGRLKGTARQAIAQAVRMTKRHAREQQVSIPDMLAMARSRFRDKTARNARFDGSILEFGRIFGISLISFRETLSWELAGVKVLDIVAFDRWLKTPDGESTADCIRAKFGAEAAHLVKSLL